MGFAWQLREGGAGDRGASVQDIAPPYGRPRRGFVRHGPRNVSECSRTYAGHADGTRRGAERPKSLRQLGSNLLAACQIRDWPVASLPLSACTPVAHSDPGTLPSAAVMVLGNAHEL